MKSIWSRPIRHAIRGRFGPLRLQIGVEVEMLRYDFATLIRRVADAVDGNISMTVFTRNNWGAKDRRIAREVVLDSSFDIGLVLDRRIKDEITKEREPRRSEVVKFPGHLARTHDDQ